MEEAGGEIILEAKEETSQEEDAPIVLQMLPQVVTSLINQRFNVIIVKNLVIMHMNAGRSNMTKESKARISR